MSDDGGRSIKRSGAQGGIVSALQAEIDRLNGTVHALSTALARERRAHKAEREESEAQAQAAIFNANESARRRLSTSFEGEWTVYRDGNGYESRTRKIANGHETSWTHDGGRSWWRSVPRSLTGPTEGPT